LTRSTISAERHDLLAGTVAAALGLHLVLDVQSRGPGLGKTAHRACDVERPAPAGIGIHQQRQCAGVGDAADVHQHVIHGADGQIRHAERIGRQPAAGNIDGTKAGGGSHARHVGIDRADQLQRPLVPERGAKSRAGR
jgi:hypothetical protein